MPSILCHSNSFHICGSVNLFVAFPDLLTSGFWHLWPKRLNIYDLTALVCQLNRSCVPEFLSNKVFVLPLPRSNAFFETVCFQLLIPFISIFRLRISILYVVTMLAYGVSFLLLSFLFPSFIILSFLILANFALSSTSSYNCGWWLSVFIATHCRCYPQASALLVEVVSFVLILQFFRFLSKKLPLRLLGGPFYFHQFHTRSENSLWILLCLLLVMKFSIYHL